MEDLIKVYDMGMNVAAPVDALDQEYEHYGAFGSLLDNLLILSLAENTSNISFHITPRGTIFLEKDGISHDEILFRQSSLSRFSNLGWDDTSLITQITMIGTVQTLTHIKKIQGGDFSSTLVTGYGYPQTGGKSFLGFPITAKVTDPNGVILVNLHEKEGDPILSNRLESGGNPIAAGTGEFKVNYHDRKIWLGDDPASSSNYWIVESTYQDTINNNKIYWTQKGGNFDSLGSYSKTWHVPHFQNTYSLSTIAGNIITKYGSLERRVTITVPTLVNHIRENYEVEVVAPDFSVGTEDTSEVNNDTPISLSVKSIKFLYPEGQTIINCGEHMFDSFDLDKAFSEAHGQQKSNIITSPA